MTKRFEKLRRLVRKRGWRGEFEYGGVVEFTGRGIAHFHVLLRGPWLLQATWSSLAVEAGFGEVVWIERASKARLTGYVTKSLAHSGAATLPGYLSKSLGAPAAFPRHFRRVRFSRGWSPDWVSRQKRDPERDGPSPWERVVRGSPLMRTYGLLVAESVRLAALADALGAGGGSP
ncbi:MAG: rolling circle replication-associated protein [Candidatus Limnocylindrales bacterium]